MADKDQSQYNFDEGRKAIISDNLLKSYGVDQATQNSDNLEKSNQDTLEKGGKRAVIGEKREFSGRMYIKTTDGWKFFGKGTGTKAQGHHESSNSKTEVKTESKKEFPFKTVAELEDASNKIFQEALKQSKKQKVGSSDFELANKIFEEKYGISEEDMKKKIITQSAGISQQEFDKLHPGTKKELENNTKKEETKVFDSDSARIRKRDLEYYIQENYGPETSDLRNSEYAIPFKKELAKIKKTLQKEAGDLEPGKTYTSEIFSDTLAGNDVKKTAKSKFLKDTRLNKEELQILDKAIGNNNSIYDYFNKNYDPTDIKIETLSEKREKVDSSNIYTLMAAKTETTYKASFQVKISYSKEPITIERVFTSDTTLSMRDINSFM